MSPFEFITVLISIILGLGITTILTGVAERIKHFHNTKLFTPYVIWISIVFMLHIHEWWNTYTLQSIEVWSLPMFLFILLYPITLYVLAHLLFPSNNDNQFDARDFYFENYRRYYVIAIALLVLGILHNVFIEHLNIRTQIGQVISLAIVTVFLISKTRKEIIHTIAAGVLLIILVSLIVKNGTLINQYVKSS